MTRANEYRSRLLASRAGRAFVLLGFIAILSSAIVVVLELSLDLFLNHPAWIPEGKPLWTMRRVYQRNRDWIQFNPRSARYDPEVSYTLRPGTFSFTSLEFETGYHVNSRGFRDDEASLRSPEIIVLGDSHAMGWGVDQEETFPQLLEQQSGAVVLNAAVSSYGTAREVIMLERLDISSLRTLILQYSSNDYPENRRFAEHGFSLPIMSRHDYARLCDYNVRTSHYRFGDYALTLAAPKVRAFADRRRYDPRNLPNRLPDEVAAPTDEEEARLFLAILNRALLGSPRIRVVVLELNSYNMNDDRFVTALAGIWGRKGEPRPYELQTLDVSRVLGEGDYYTLDDHMRPSGHEAVAAALLEILGSPRSFPRDRGRVAAPRESPDARGARMTSWIAGLSILTR